MSELTLNTEKVVPVLVDFLKAQIFGAGFQRAVVGLSGGVDSSLSCTLAARALGPSNVMALLMPYRTSHPDSLKHAYLLADRLGVERLEIPISAQVDPYFERFPDADPNRRGNKMARERMSILYDQSACFEGLVVGTSNRTEILLGYGTLFGDTACAVNPLGGLYKTQVFQVARAVEVPEEIVSKAPTADLWVGQTDEGELGFPYKEMDRLLYHMIDLGQNDEKLRELGFDQDFVDKIRGLVSRFKFKSQPPLVAPIPPDLRRP